MRRATRHVFAATLRKSTPRTRRTIHHSSPNLSSSPARLPTPLTPRPAHHNPSFPWSIYDVGSPWAFLTRFRIKIVYPMPPERVGKSYAGAGPGPGGSKVKPKGGFYGVLIGRQPGIFKTWSECEASVKGYKDAIYKKFPTFEQAEAYVRHDPSEFRNNKLIPPPPSVESNTVPSAPCSSSTGLRPFFATEPASAPVRPVSDLFSPPASTSQTAKPVSATLQQATASGFTVSPDGYLVVYTDGSSRGNGQKGSKAGCGVWWGDKGEARRSNLAERVPGSLQTNNRGELLAIIRALEACPYPEEPIEIRTDSQYAISCITQYLPSWIRNNFRTSTGAPVSNVDMIVHLLALINRRGKGSGVKFTHVKAHVGEVGNEAADVLANQGAMEFPIPDRTNWLTLEDANRSAAEHAQKLRSLAKNGPTEPADNIVEVECEIDPSWLMSEEEIAELNAN